MKTKVKSILLVYLLLLVLGSVFTLVKYRIFGSEALSFGQIFHKLIIVYALTGIILLFFTLFSLLGRYRMERDLE